MSQSTFENLYVHKSYDEIYSSFSTTRNHSWHSTIEFIKSLPRFSCLLDAGCGNGRNMIIRNDIITVGFDMCSEFMNICNKNNLNIFHENIKHIALRDNSFDNIICVAVIGHIFSESDRIMAIDELLRIVKCGGKILIQTWKINTHDKNVHPSKFENIGTIGSDDYLVSFGTQKVKRYYHFYSVTSLNQLLLKCKCKILDIHEDEHNVSAIIEKIEIMNI